MKLWEQEKIPIQKIINHTFAEEKQNLFLIFSKIESRISFTTFMERKL